MFEGTRIFGRVRAFDCECPRCGEVLRITLKGQKHKNLWDQRRSWLRCRACGKTYYVGLILWDPVQGGRQFAPEDTIPSARQAAALRLQLNVWAKEKRPGGRLESGLGLPVNRVVPMGPRGKRVEDFDPEFPTLPGGKVFMADEVEEDDS